MSPVIDYYYSTRSVFAYLGAAEIGRLAKASGRRLVHHPLNLAELLASTGGQAFDQRSEIRRAYFFGVEIERWGKRRGVPVLLDPTHHYGGRELSSGAVLAAQSMGADVDALSEAILTALWRDDRDLDDPAVIGDLARQVGVDSGALLTAALSPAIQEAFRASTPAAAARGVLGSPTYIIDSEVFYGQDRLDFVAEALGVSGAR